MHHSHPIDRLVVKFRAALIVLAALCLPAFLVTYGLMVRSALTAWPWWGSAIMVVSHFTALLGLSSLIDIRQSQKSRTEGGQS